MRYLVSYLPLKIYSPGHLRVVFTLIEGNVMCVLYGCVTFSGATVVGCVQRGLYGFVTDKTK